MTGFTALETAVMSALAWELSDVAPDLSGQFEESLPGLRRNTGFGLYSETIVSARRPMPSTRATGRFGTVHAMVGDLPDPIAFQVELREGRLLALYGDSYGQDTRGINFAVVPFDQVFTVDERGESILYDPAAHMPPSPLLDLQRPEPQISTEPSNAPQRLEDPASARLDQVFKLDEGDEARLRGEDTVLIAGALLTAVAVAFVAVFLFQAPIAIVIALGIGAAHLLRRRPARQTLLKALRALQAQLSKASATR